MLRPTPMKHVRILVLGEELPQASLTLAELESFHAAVSYTHLTLPTSDLV